MNSKAKILVVDDDPNLSRLVRLFLEKTGRYEVREVNRSSDALKTARAFMPDMILLDVDMPGKDGGDVAAELDAEPALRGRPRLFVTSLVTPGESSNQPVMRGESRFLGKPINPTVLVRTVDRMLGEAMAHAA